MVKTNAAKGQDQQNKKACQLISLHPNLIANDQVMNVLSVFKSTPDTLLKMGNYKFIPKFSEMKDECIIDMVAQI